MSSISQMVLLRLFGVYQAFINTRRCRPRNDSGSEAENICYPNSIAWRMHGRADHDLSDIITSWRAWSAWLEFILDELAVWREKIVVSLIDYRAL